jgi:anti-sigma B factor antagonist
MEVFEKRMEIFERKEKDRHILFLKGSLDTLTAPLLMQKFEQLKNSTTDLTLDLSELKYISSAGLRVFIIMMKRIKAGKGNFSICSICDDVRDIFNTVGFLDLFIQEKESVIIVKEKNDTKASLILSGSMDLAAGMTLNTQLEGLEHAGFTNFILDMSQVTVKTPEFTAVLKEIQRRISKKGKVTIFYSGKSEASMSVAT